MLVYLILSSCLVKIILISAVCVSHPALVMTRPAHAPNTSLRPAVPSPKGEPALRSIARLHLAGYLQPRSAPALCLKKLSSFCNGKKQFCELFCFYLVNGFSVFDFRGIKYISKGLVPTSRHLYIYPLPFSRLCTVHKNTFHAGIDDIPFCHIELFLPGPFQFLPYHSNL